VTKKAGGKPEKVIKKMQGDSVQDAKMPLWGPYSKKYMGISKVVEHAQTPGARFDLTVFPTLANSGVPAPNVTCPTGYHPWEAAPNLSYFSYRCELEWKDRVYADTAFVRLDAHHTLVRVAVCNRTALMQNCMVNFFASIEYPHPYSTRLVLPQGTLAIPAQDYTEYRCAVPRPWEHLNPDGARRGVFPDPDFTGGWGLGDRINRDHLPWRQFLPFGGTAGDTVHWQVPAAPAFRDAVLLVRFRTPDVCAIHSTNGLPPFQGGRPSTEMVPQGDAHFALTANGARREICLPAGGTLHFAAVPLGRIKAGPLEIALESMGGGCVELDALVLAEAESAAQVDAERVPHAYQPKRIEQNGQNGTVCYRYAGVEDAFWLTTFGGRRHDRALASGALEDALLPRVSNPDATFDDLANPFTASFARKHSDDGWFENTLLHGLYVEPGGQKTVYAVIGDAPSPLCTAAECEAAYQRARAAFRPFALKPAGECYRFGNECLRAALLTNVVYPIWRHGKPIVHHTPGKRWDCLYTWDSGFIGLGLLEADPALALRTLDLYLSEPDNPDFAFLFHGSPVPVQFYLYAELLKRQNDKSALYGRYPQLLRYYNFLAGKTEGSTTARLGCGMTTTYDYFYSTSGMDDYPAQVLMHAHGLEERTAPVISTAQLIRCAKLLRAVALELGKTEDIQAFDADIARWTQALQDFSWDEESGYFGYVLHDAANRPCGILRTDTGENADKGLDGVYPLIAGACTPKQEKRLLAHLMTPGELLSPVGISAVDQSAEYFQDDGYWNGNVWFAHQWFLWKTMFDLAQPEFAWQIARIALDAWQREVDDSYNTFEMMNIATGRGGWFHQFGGLSAPLNIWACAYFCPGTVTTGLDVFVRSAAWDTEKTELTLSLRREIRRAAVVLVCLAQRTQPYTAAWNGAALPVAERLPGTVEITLPPQACEGTLRVS
jgi:hypothetical protein